MVCCGGRGGRYRGHSCFEFYFAPSGGSEEEEGLFEDE